MDGDERRDPGNLPTIADGLAGGLDVALGVGAGAAGLARAAVVRPATATAVRVLRLGGQLFPGASRLPLVTGLTNRGQQVRDRLHRAAAETLRRAVEAALTAIDLTELVRAHVDLDALAARIDVDAVVARADIDAVVARADLDAAVRGVDLDAIVGRIDVDAIVAGVDLDAIVGRIDVDAIVGGLDLDAIVNRVDVDGVASRIDLDAIMQRVEPDDVVARVDVEAVLARLDLAGIARQVIDAIDLPGILRESTGAVSSQAARVVRTEGMNADDSVARFIDRVLRRTHPQGALAP